MGYTTPHPRQVVQFGRTRVLVPRCTDSNAQGGTAVRPPPHPAMDGAPVRGSPPKTCQQVSRPLQPQRSVRPELLKDLCRRDVGLPGPEFLDEEGESFGEMRAGGGLSPRRRAIRCADGYGTEIIGRRHIVFLKGGDPSTIGTSIGVASACCSERNCEEVGYILKSSRAAEQVQDRLPVFTFWSSLSLTALGSRVPRPSGLSVARLVW
jgi:hypothetical protein